MKQEISLAFLILLIFSAFTFYVSALEQPGKPETQSEKLQRLQYEKEKLSRDMLLISPERLTDDLQMAYFGIDMLEKRTSELEKRMNHLMICTILILAIAGLYILIRSVRWARINRAPQKSF